MRETAIILVLVLVGVTAWRKRSFPLLAQAAVGRVKLDPTAANAAAAGTTGTGTVTIDGKQVPVSSLPPLVRSMLPTSVTGAK